MKFIGRPELEVSENLSFTRRGSLSLVSVAIQGLIRFAYSVLVGRLLTPGLLAATNSAISLAQFMALLWPTGSNAATTKYVALAKGAGEYDQMRRIATHLGTGTLISAIVLAIPAGIYSFAFQARGDWVTAGLVVLLVIAWSAYTYVRGLYFAIGQIARATVWDGASTVIALGLLVCVIALGWTALLLLPLTLGYLAYAIAGWPRRARGITLKPALVAEMNGFIIWTVIGTLASSGFLQLTMLIAHAVGTATEAGMYAAALTLATPASMVARSLSLLLFPSMAHAVGRNDMASLRKQTDLATRGLIALMGGIFGILVLASAPIILIAYGERYEAANSILPILLGASLLSTLNVASVNSLSTATARGVRIPSLLSVIGAILGLAAMAAFITAGQGVQGVAWGYLVGTAWIGLGPVVAVWWRERMNWAGVWIRFAIGASIAIALFITMNALNWGLAGNAISVVIFAALWLLLMGRELRTLNQARKPSRS